MVLLVFACAKLGPSPKGTVPPRPKVTPNDVKKAVQDAHAACASSKATLQCRVMWDRVDELSHALARQQEREREDELETREYDV